MKFSMKSLGFSNEDKVGVSKKKYLKAPFSHFEIHQVNSSGRITGKARDSPASSILKTPTAIFVTSRNSSARTKRLKFANVPTHSMGLRKGSQESNDSSVDSVEDRKESNGEAALMNETVEVAISPEETMHVSLEAWKAFLEYKKFNDYSNETEKTDYTYSRLSKFRHKEIIPGFIIRPNMSRPSLSSRRSSVSLPSSFSSFTESFYSDEHKNGAYGEEFTTQVAYDSKTPKQANNKSTRSKYYLRSSNMGVDKTEDSKPIQNARNFVSEFSGTASNSFPYFFSEFPSTSPHSYIESPEKMSMSFLDSRSEMSERSSPYYYKIRCMNLDDSDIDEVDINDRKNFLSSEKNHRIPYQTQIKSQHNKSLSQWFGNLFTSLFLFVTTIGTFTKDLFLKYILKRKNDQSYNSFYGKWGKCKNNALSSKSKVPWFGKKNNNYYPSSYYSERYYGQPKTWYQRLYYYLQDNFLGMFNMLWRGTPVNEGSKYYQTLRKRKFWWLLIPLLLLSGSILGCIDLFSPKAVLNTLCNGARFVPSFIYYTFMVFIPNFLTVTIPDFFLNTIFYYFWRGAHFFANLSIANVWPVILGNLNFFSQLLLYIGHYLLNTFYTIVTIGYLFSSKYLMLLYSNFCTMLFALLANTFNCVIRFFNIFCNSLYCIGVLYK